MSRPLLQDMPTFIERNGPGGSLSPSTYYSSDLERGGSNDLTARERLEDTEDDMCEVESDQPSGSNDEVYYRISGQRTKGRIRFAIWPHSGRDVLAFLLAWLALSVLLLLWLDTGCLWSSCTELDREVECRDPYTGLGCNCQTLEGAQENTLTSIDHRDRYMAWERWIPYDPESPDLISNATTISASLDPPASALARATDPYNSWLRSDSRATDEGLTFMKNRTVIFVGDSHDRRNIVTFCAQHPHANLKVPGGHLKAFCKIDELHFTLASWFMFGMAEESQEWYMGGEEGPRSFEERLKQRFVPDVANIGYPSLIVLNSFYWDLRYFAQYAQHYGHSNLTSDERPLTYSELEWHRSRLVVYVNIFRTTFPGVPIMFRLGQAHATNRNGGNVAVYQMNKSIRAIMSHLKVPIFEWATLLAGEEEYLDDQHLKDGKPAWLFGNMMLYYLKRAVEKRCPM